MSLNVYIFVRENGWGWPLYMRRSCKLCVMVVSCSPVASGGLHCSVVEFLDWNMPFCWLILLTCVYTDRTSSIQQSYALVAWISWSTSRCLMISRELLSWRPACASPQSLRHCTLVYLFLDTAFSDKCSFGGNELIADIAVAWLRNS